MTKMDRAEYLRAVNEFLYQGEVLGEAVVFTSYVCLEENAERRYKWGTLLQFYNCCEYQAEQAEAQAALWA